MSIRSAITHAIEMDNVAIIEDGHSDDDVEVAVSTTSTCGRSGGSLWWGGSDLDRERSEWHDIRDIQVEPPPLEGVLRCRDEVVGERRGR